MLKPGEPAPDFALVDQRGDEVALSSFKGRRVLVFFYPKADTSGCTTQACGLRDALPELGDTAVVGISPDAPEAQAAFDEKHSMGYPLLSDPDRAVADEYGVWGDKHMYGRTYQGIIRSAFLIDGQGTITEAWYKISPKDTATKARQALAG